MEMSPADRRRFYPALRKHGPNRERKRVVNRGSPLPDGRSSDGALFETVRLVRNADYRRWPRAGWAMVASEQPVSPLLYPMLENDLPIGFRVFRSSRLGAVVGQEKVIDRQPGVQPTHGRIRSLAFRPCLRLLRDVYFDDINELYRLAAVDFSTKSRRATRIGSVAPDSQLEPRRIAWASTECDRSLWRMAKPARNPGWAPASAGLR